MRLQYNDITNETIKKACKSDPLFSTIRRVQDNSGVLLSILEMFPLDLYVLNDRDGFPR